MSNAGSRLEITYRRTLNAYPRSWRSNYGDEFIGVMLDIAESQQRTTPKTTELVNLVFHGITARLLLVISKIAPIHRRNRVSAAATVTTTAMAVAMMILGELGRWFRWNSYTQADGLFGSFTTVASIVYLLTIASFIALAMGWEGTRRLILWFVLVACMALPFLTNLGQNAAVVEWYVPMFFAVASFLALCGTPTHTPALKRTVLTAAPTSVLLLTWAGYLAGGGSQRTFYNPNHVIFDALGLTRSVAEVLAVTTIILLANRKLLPWVILVGGIALYHPLTNLLIMVGGNPGTGLVGIQPNKILAICCIVAPLAAWIAWKRPRLEFTPQTGKMSGS